MALRSVRQLLLVVCVLVFLVSPTTIYSCGPFLEWAVFAFKDSPDGPVKNFADGKLGIVRPDFRHSFLIVAYRTLSGLKLTEEQQKVVTEVWSPDVELEQPGEVDATAIWKKTRDKVPGLPSQPEISAEAAVSKDEPYFQYLNCPRDAFQSASRVLDERIAKFGADAAPVREWVAGQDQVFENCGGGERVIPSVLTSGDAQLLADRDYQIAAAYFYARDFDEAAKRFNAIASSKSSPWASLSSYLAARALIRKATLVHPQTEEFDRAAMLEAQKRLEDLIADRQTVKIHEPAVKLLNFVRFRTEPEKRVAELDRMMLEPNPGANFKQDFWDYVLLLSRNKEAGDPSDWVQSFRSLSGPSGIRLGEQSEVAKHVMARWRETKSLPWLIAGLVAAKGGDVDTESLLAAADKIPVTSPGYLTVRYYALRLRLATGKTDVARKELDSLLANNGVDIPLGSRNLLNEERVKITTSFEDFLQHAAETPVPSDFSMGVEQQIPVAAEPAKPGQPLFNRYTAGVFLKRLPMTELVRAAQSPEFPQHLRREVARSAWVRSVLLEDWVSAAKLQNILQEVDPPLWKSMEPFRSAKNDAERRFVGVFIILNNPGMMPSARQGLLRSGTLGAIDNYRDNWWCDDIDPGLNRQFGNDGEPIAEGGDSFPPSPVWLSEAQKVAAKSEWDELMEAGAAPSYLAAQVLAYAKLSPEEPRIPEALHLVVRATRYGCTDKESSKFSKAAFDVLHKRYPESEWAAKTKYYY